MEKRRQYKKWQLCPNCLLMIYASSTLGNHVCPDKVRAKQDFELDLAVDATMDTWDQDVKKFWNSKDVKFNEWLADHRRI